MTMVDPGATRRYAILVVEDEPGIRGALELLLGLEGFGVVTASDGLKGLDALAHAEFDLILTDYMMPLMDGPTFLARVRTDGCYGHIPAILMSSVPRAPESVKPLADLFIAKPFEIPALLQAIRTLLRDGRDPSPGH